MIRRAWLWKERLMNLAERHTGICCGVLLALYLLSVLACSGCATLKPIGIDLAACAAGQVPGAVSSIIPDVQTALSGDSPSWAADLQAIGTKAGIDALICAVKAVMADVHLGATPLHQKMKTRGEAFLAAHGIQ